MTILAGHCQRARLGREVVAWVSRYIGNRRPATRGVFPAGSRGRLRQSVSYPRRYLCVYEHVLLFVANGD